MTSISSTNTEKISFLKSETAQIVMGVSLLFCGSQLSIPLQPVPITFQMVPVILIGLFYARNTAIKTLISYLTLGAVGAPLFANFSAGPAALFGPTGGYLFGFLAAVYAMTIARERVFKQTYLTMTCNALLGTALIYLCGVSWLALFIGGTQAINYGFLPFIVPDLVKAIIIAFTVRSIKE